MVNPKPKANFVMQDTTCLPNATTFTSTSTIADGTTPVGHLWNFGDPASGLNNSSISNPTSHIYSSVSNYNVQLIVVSALGCADTTTPPKQLKSTSLHNAPIALYTVNTLSHDTPRVCVETPIIFKDASNNVKTSYWVWGDNGATIELGTLPAPQFGSTVAGTYYGQHYIDDNWGCRSQPTPIVTIIDAYPTVQGGTKYVLPNTPNLLNPTITNAANVIWKVTSPIGSLFDYLDDNTSETPICTPPTDITYLITATSEFGCPDTASYYVKLLKKPQIPTAFSPNGDGINDFWIIDNLKEYPGATVQVFDRYGQVVLNKFGYSSPWNGKKAGNGEDLPIGVYYYIIKPGLGLPLMTGYVTILR
jgi:gliding motility-associated-like protein